MCTGNMTTILMHDPKPSASASVKPRLHTVRRPDGRLLYRVSATRFASERHGSLPTFTDRLPVRAEGRATALGKRLDHGPLSVVARVGIDRREELLQRSIATGVLVISPRPMTGDYEAPDRIFRFSLFIVLIFNLVPVLLRFTGPSARFARSWFGRQRCGPCLGDRGGWEG